MNSTSAASRLFLATRSDGVIALRGGSASAFLPGLAWSLLLDDAPELVLQAVHVDRADVRLRPHEEVTVSLASAFQPRDPEREPTPGPSPSLSLEIRAIVIDHLWIHGQVEGSLKGRARACSNMTALSNTSTSRFPTSTCRANSLYLGISPI